MKQQQQGFHHQNGAVPNPFHTRKKPLDDILSSFPVIILSRSSNSIVQSF
jgi:hypothetical protein